MNNENKIGSGSRILATAQEMYDCLKWIKDIGTAEADNTIKLICIDSAVTFVLNHADGITKQKRGVVEND